MAKEKQAVTLPDFMTVRQLAELISSSPIDVMKKLIANGILASINQQIDFDTAAIVLEEFGYEAVSQSAIEEKAKEQQRTEEITRKCLGGNGPGDNRCGAKNCGCSCAHACGTR